ncbi:MAG: hypothetical protein ABSC37_03080 [Xanthobacteraceae bacterium]
MAGRANHTQPNAKSGRVEAHPGMKDQTVNSRDLEHLQHRVIHEGNIALDPGKNSSKHAASVPPRPHLGMTHQQNGVTLAGISKTQAGHALAVTPLDQPNPLWKPPQGKALTAPAINPGMNRTRSGKAISDLDHAKLGALVLAQAYSVAGSDHPANLGRRIK